VKKRMLGELEEGASSEISPRGSFVM